VRATDRPSLIVAVVGATSDVDLVTKLAPLATRLRKAGIGAAFRVPCCIEADERSPTLAERLSFLTGESPFSICRPGRTVGVDAPPTWTVRNLLHELHAHPSVTVIVVALAGPPDRTVAADGTVRDFWSVLDPDMTAVVVGSDDPERIAAEALRHLRVNVRQTA
jgi:hypothetical protein